MARSSQAKRFSSDGRSRPSSCASCFFWLPHCRYSSPAQSFTSCSTIPSCSFEQVSIIRFLTDTEWTPVFENPKFGIMTLVSGTLMTTFIGLLVAVPAGTILSIYLSEFARPAMRETIKPILELLAGVPTVAFGYFALFFLTPIFQMLHSGTPGLQSARPRHRHRDHDPALHRLGCRRCDACGSGHAA